MGSRTETKMSIITIAAFAGGFVAGFAVGVIASENGKVRTSDLTEATEAAISKAKSAFTFLTNYEHRIETRPSGSVPKA